MIPCEKCGARGQDPCLTSAGLIARATHKVRVVDEVGQFEQATLDSIGEASWILVTDAGKVEAVLQLAREADKAVRHRAEQTRNATLELFDVESPEASGPDGLLIYLVMSYGLTLDSLGLSPKGRKELNIESEEVGQDAVADLRDRFGLAG